RPSTEPDRGTHALAIPENIKPKPIGDRRGAYYKSLWNSRKNPLKSTCEAVQHCISAAPSNSKAEPLTR
ncbi:hypothetical protein, partial [Mesorhizobium sp. M0244]|uniref:hypothetical protein n=1 Tax=Mesorhizobium sp. M0244 TaxID=2956926 RepID=UPI00333D4F68